MIDPALRSSAAHVFVASLEQPELTDEDAHHLGRVLRLRAGDAVSVADGAGRWVLGRWHAGSLEVDGEASAGTPRPACTVAAALPKGDRPEWMVQKLVEVGVGTIALVEFARSTVRWEDAARADGHLARLRRVAREAAMQSRRVWLPEIVAPRSYDAVLTSGPASALAVADPLGGPLTNGVHVVVIGPEGGLTDDERIRAPRLAALAATVLRVETAAIVAAILMGQVHDDPG